MVDQHDIWQFNHDGVKGHKPILISRVWLACFFQVDISVLFDLDIDIHVNIVRKQTETLAKEIFTKTQVSQVIHA